MTYRFTTRSTGDVLMLHPDGDAILRILGKTPAVRGIIEPAALSAAITALEQAASREDEVSPEDGGVKLRQRTWPLLRMLKSAQSAQAEVVWGY